MPIEEFSNRILSNVDPSRREFVKRVLAGAAFAVPVVASFSIESLLVTPAYAQSSFTPCQLSLLSNGPHGSPGPGSDPGYVGPSRFKAYLFDSNTKVNGQLNLDLDPNGRSIDVRLRMVKYANIQEAALLINCITVATIRVGGRNPDDSFHSSLDSSDLTGYYNMDGLFAALASGQVTALALGSYDSTSFNAQGPVAAAAGGPVIKVNG